MLGFLIYWCKNVGWVLTHLAAFETHMSFKNNA